MQQFVAFIAELLELAARSWAGGFAYYRHINLTTKTCRCDGYRPDTLRSGVGSPVSFSAFWEPAVAG